MLLRITPGSSGKGAQDEQQVRSRKCYITRHFLLSAAIISLIHLHMQIQPAHVVTHLDGNSSPGKEQLEPAAWTGEAKGNMILH